MPLQTRTKRRHPRFCPQCGALLIVTQHDVGEQRRCRRCGWRYEPQPRLAITAVVEWEGSVVLVPNPTPCLPNGLLVWGEDPSAAALRVAHTVTGLRVADPQFLGFVQTADYEAAEEFTLTFCYVVQASGASLRALPTVHAARLRELPYLPSAACRYAIDAYRAWLERKY